MNSALGVPASGKSPEAFRTIGEVAAELDVPQHVLRFWETRFAQIRPIKRAGGRRFYRPEDVDLLRGIRVLLYYDGYTIKGVQKVLREKGARHAAARGRSEAAPRAANGAGDAAPAERLAFDGLAARREDDGDATRRPVLGEENRAALRRTLAELLDLKSRLHAARKFTSA